MNRILFPTDLSKGADTALNYMLHFAHEAEAKIHLLHIQQDFDDEAQFYDNKLRQLLSSSDILDILKQYSELKNQNYDGDRIITSVDLIEPSGSIVDSIVEFANDHQFDLISIGTQGENPWLKKILGSTSLGVLENAQQPVLCIPSDFEYKYIDKLVLGVDFQSISKAALNYSINLANIFKSELKVVDVNIANNPLLIENRDEWAKVYNQEENVDFIILEGLEVVPSLTDYIIKEDAELLLLNSQKRSFFEKLFERSYSEEFIDTKAVPVLVTKF